MAEDSDIMRDDSDQFEGERSGMVIYTDYKTGCQYLSQLFGGPTPRLDHTGRQICRYEKSNDYRYVTDSTYDNPTEDYR